jgi:hypothetical protein
MKSIKGHLIFALVLLAIAGLAFISFSRWLRQKAVQECLLVGRNVYENLEANSRAEVPDFEIYQRCMKEKGY